MLVSMAWCETRWGLHHACMVGLQALDRGAVLRLQQRRTSLNRLAARIQGRGLGATYSSVGSLEAVDLLLGAVELVLGSQRLEDLDNVVPKLLMVLIQ